MPPQQRKLHDDPFSSHSDFNEQLYLALKQSPWWMISIAIHVIFFLIAGMLTSSEPTAPPKKQASIQATSDVQEEELDEVEEETKEIHSMEEVVPEPVIKDTEIVRPRRDRQRPPLRGVPRSRTASRMRPSTVRPTTASIGLGGGAGGAFRGRGGGRDLGGGGGGKRARRAVDDALKWLAAHQSPDGGWEAAGFNKWCDGKPATQAVPTASARRSTIPGVTGLALCAFLGAGYTNRGKHPFAKVVSRGLRYLKNVQDAEGCFGPRTTPALHLQPRHGGARDGRGLRHDGESDLQGLGAEGLGLHRPGPQPVLRVALRRQAGRQRHLRDGLDDDGAQERQDDQRGRGVPGQVPLRSSSTTRPSTA